MIDLHEIPTDAELAEALIPAHDLSEPVGAMAILMVNDLDHLPPVLPSDDTPALLAVELNPLGPDALPRAVGVYAKHTECDLGSLLLRENDGLLLIPSVIPYNMDGPDEVPVTDDNKELAERLQATNRTYEYRLRREAALAERAEQDALAAQEMEAAQRPIQGSPKPRVEIQYSTNPYIDL